MIDGIGVDVVQLARIKTVIQQWGSVFLTKIFTQQEIEYCQSKKNSEQHFAARFAAKEAMAKALSIGWSQNFRWRDIEVINDSTGKPSIITHDELNKSLKSKKIFLTISHSESTIIAFVIIEH